MAEVEYAGGLVVRSTPEIVELAAPTRELLVADGVPGRLVARDDLLWGPDAQPEASIRLGSRSWANSTGWAMPMLPESVRTPWW